MKKIKFTWIIIFLLGFGLRSTYISHPIDTASWRESDIASIARNYYRHNMDFFHPQIDWGGKGPGYTEMEFPIYPYLIASSYKIFGLHEMAGRIISLLFSLAAMLVFFRFSKFLFNDRTALVVSALFAINPLLNIVSDAIQPESVMFFFYVSAAYAFLRWIDDQSQKYYILALMCTALALLVKISAAHIGILFVLLIITKKNWRFLFNPKVLLFGVFSIVPSIIWYGYAHHFYVQYGNSLGLSNEYAWVGWDFFTDPYFIKGIIKLELHNVWTIAGPLIIILAIFSTKIIKNPAAKFSFYWLAATAVFYIIASRTTADSWAYYYHIFSVPAASILIGSSIMAIYDKYFPVLKFKADTLPNFSFLVINSALLLLLAIFVVFQVYLSSKYIIQNKRMAFQTSKYYASARTLSDLIPKGSIILASGFVCEDNKGYPTAYNSSYFFYWLDRKGFNICIEAQSIENVNSFHKKGAAFFIAEKSALKKKSGFEKELKTRFDAIYEDNGILVFHIAQ